VQNEGTVPPASPPPPPPPPPQAAAVQLVRPNSERSARRSAAGANPYAVRVEDGAGQTQVRGQLKKPKNRNGARRAVLLDKSL